MALPIKQSKISMNGVFKWFILLCEVSRLSFLSVKSETNKLATVDGGRRRGQPSWRGLCLWLHLFMGAASGRRTQQTTWSFCTLYRSVDAATCTTLADGSCSLTLSSAKSFVIYSGKVVCLIFHRI
ncbi:unnamed protein product [Ixodes pacificus]